MYTWSPCLLRLKPLALRNMQDHSIAAHSAIVSFIHASERSKLHARPHPLETSARSCVIGLWRTLEREGRELLSKKPRLFPRADINSCIHHLTACLQDCLVFICTLYDKLPATKNSAQIIPSAHVNIGVGNPGPIGCLDVRGTSVYWPPLLDKEYGALTAMHKLDLVLLGLPGARLPEGFCIPNTKHIHVEARRCNISTYASVAVLWNTECGLPIECLHSHSSNRVIWASVGHGTHALEVCTFYLPPSDDSIITENLWHDVLNNISQSIDTIQQSSASKGFPRPTFILQGDANMQPASLGRGPDPMPRRDQHWQQLLVKHKLVLLNPSMHGCSEYSIQLPHNGKQVRLVSGDTHYGTSKSRIIDLVACSESFPCEISVHNGVHCHSATDCIWKTCNSYAKSDHFLVTNKFKLPSTSLDLTTSVPQFPAAWRNADKWKAGLDVAAPALRAISSLVDAWHELLLPYGG